MRELSLHEIGLVDGGLNWGYVYRGAAAGAIGGAIAGAIGGGPIGMGGGAIGGAIGGGLVSIFDQLSV
ncbi:hypothetical protein C9J98_05255 [Stenotrophomonas panacihumi]|nr:hypothetical protein C9J98_05255 [Stenotrophomonas panacihumi]